MLYQKKKDCQSHQYFLNEVIKSPPKTSHFKFMEEKKKANILSFYLQLLNIIGNVADYSYFN